MATGFTAAIVALYVAYLAGVDLWLLGTNTRAVAGAVLVLGMGACATGASTATQQRGGIVGGVITVLGITALLALAVAVIFGNSVALAIPVATTVALWLVATARHLFAGPSRPTDAQLRRLVDDQTRQRQHN